MDNWNNKQTDQLARAILGLETIGEVKNFLRDLLTPGEIIEFGKRWQVANLLYKNTPYSKIEEKTGMSSTTIARVSKFLNNGMNGYRQVLEKQNHHQLPSSGERS